MLCSVRIQEARLRTPNPLTAIRRIRHELERLEAQVVARAKKLKEKARPQRRGRQVCSVCGKPGHNSRFHKTRRRR